MTKQTHVQIKTPDDIAKIRESAAARIAMRESRPCCAGSGMAKPSGAKGKFEIMLCMGTSCISSGAEKIRDALTAEIKKRKLDRKVSIVETGCNGFCAAGPIMVVYPGGWFYNKVTPEDATAVISEHIMAGRPLERLMFMDPVTNKTVPHYDDIPFFAGQQLDVLRNKGKIAAESIEDYIGRDGYSALVKALAEMTPDGIIAEMKKSGLRGRGGAGFLTGLKWELCRKAVGDRKFILCNADEGDPGAFMDRSLIESDPHVVIEGMMIGARAIGADTGYVYCRAEYPLALQRLEKAISECRRRGLLGKGILGTDFDFDVHIAQGSGAFVCGEETALMRSVEGKRGEPRPRPPFPAQKGLWDKPSVLNNVETFGNVPLIIRNGAAKFASSGTAKSPGTKIFALTGKVNNVGLIEVPVGTSLGTLIYDIGGGIPNGKQFKAAQIGGPSGGCIPRQHLNVPVDYESLAELGAIMGSGGLIVMDEETCMVDMARYFMDFVQDESCGKCVPCRVGTKRMLEILDRICKGQGEMADLDRLEALGNQIKDTALCGLGQTAPNPVLSTLRHFRDEYIAHIRDKRCPAGVCAELVRAPCQNACPAGVDVPGFVSMVGEKRYADALRRHRERNPLAAICAYVCFHPCETRCRRATLDSPVSIRNVKRFMVETEKRMELPEARRSPENAKRKIAIIGAGPAGLSCAYFLARLGYKPKVFEAEKKAGGMLIQAIPSYRLPRAALEREIKMIQAMGVTMKTGACLGRDFTLESLRKQGFEAVFLGVGAPRGTRINIPGEGVSGVADGISFLREFNLKGSTAVGKKVLVIGGGNVAVDVARTALRLGAESVTIVYRRTRDQMPAYAEEVEEAEKEGVKFVFLAAPEEVVSSNGRASGLLCQRMELCEFDRSGRKGTRKIAGDTFVLDADQVISAIGQSLRGEDFAKTADLVHGNWIKADPLTGQTAVEWLFAGGDAATGPASVVEAIAAGERAAVGIDKLLTAEAHAFWRVDKPVDVFFDPDADPVSFDRAVQRLLPVNKRRRNFSEVELTFAQRTALLEAKRCLRCDFRDCEA